MIVPNSLNYNEAWRHAQTSILSMPGAAMSRWSAAIISWRSASSDEALGIDPDAVNVLMWRGYAHERRGQYEAALRDYARAAKFQPDDVSVRESNERMRTAVRELPIQDAPSVSALSAPTQRLRGQECHDRRCRCDTCYHQGKKVGFGHARPKTAEPAADEVSDKTGRQPETHDGGHCTHRRDFRDQRKPGRRQIDLSDRNNREISDQPTSSLRGRLRHRLRRQP